MVNYPAMELISDLESDALGIGEAPPPSLVTLRTSSGECELRMPQLGNDYVAGLSHGVLVVLPLSNVLEIRGSQLPNRVDQGMVEFLVRQRTPVRLRINSEVGGDCWLLNIEDSWLRIAISQGVSWVPMSAIRGIEILPVDNSNQ